MYALCSHLYILMLMTSGVQVVTRVLLNHKSYTDSVTHSPYFVGIITGSFVWVGFCWFTRLVQSEHPHSSILIFDCNGPHSQIPQDMLSHTLPLP